MAKRRSKSRTLLLVILLALVAIQFWPVDREVPEYDTNKDLIAMTNPPGELGHLLKVACYDCHSYNTRYPWYSYIAPVSIWVQNSHVINGRKHLNFSLWGTYDADKQDHKLEECVEMVGEGHMPLDSYLWMHSDARLTDDQREEMTSWFQGLRTAIGD